MTSIGGEFNSRGCASMHVRLWGFDWSSLESTLNESWMSPCGSRKRHCCNILRSMVAEPW